MLHRPHFSAMFQLMLMGANCVENACGRRVMALLLHELQPLKPQLLAFSAFMSHNRNRSIVLQEVRKMNKLFALVACLGLLASGCANHYEIRSTESGGAEKPGVEAPAGQQQNNPSSYKFEGAE